MKTKVTEEMIAAYLYGELSQEEKEKFEQQLQSDPKLALEVKELSEARAVLEEVRDEEVLGQGFRGEPVSAKWISYRMIGNWILKPAIGLAASISFVILIGYMTDLRIVSGDGSLSINFGDRPDQIDRSLTEQEVESLVASVLQKDRNEWYTRVNDLEREVDTRFATLSEGDMDEDSPSSEELMNTLVQQLQRENRAFLAEFGENSSLNQQNYMRAMLEEFAVFWREQREEDLRRIQYNFDQMQQSQQQQQAETDVVLASIMNTVNNQNE